MGSVNDSSVHKATSKHLETGQRSYGPCVDGKFPSVYETVTTWSRKPYTRESLWRSAMRCCILILLPTVLWASLVMSVLIGFLVAISTNLTVAFTATYNFSNWQVGLCNVAGVIGAAFAVFFGGKFSDMIVDHYASKNDGIKKPEMRLPPMLISVVTGPLSLILYGIGIEREWHWIIPTVGLGLCKHSDLAPLFLALLIYYHFNFHPKHNNAWILTAYSKLHHRSICKHFSGLYSGLLSNHCWRGHCHSICIQV